VIVQMAAGAVIGLGFLLLIWVLAKPAPGVGATLARLDAGRRSQRSQTTTAASSRWEARLDAFRDGIGGRLEAEAMARGWRFEATRTNLAVMNKSMASHIGLKVLMALAALVWFPIVLSAAGISVAGLPAVGVIAAAVGAFMLPDLTLRREADARRADFRHVMGSFLDLVAMNLAGGRGLPEALMAASSIGDHWAMVRIRQALSNARIMGMTPWEGISELGRDLGVDELRDLASALALAGDEGAKIRTSLMSRSDSMRRKELVEVEGAVGESSQSMLLAQLLMCVAFLICLAYPAIQQLGGT